MCDGLIEPENQTICPITGGNHTWLYLKEQQDYICDACGVLESHQED